MKNLKEIIEGAREKFSEVVNENPRIVKGLPQGWEEALTQAFHAGGEDLLREQREIAITNRDAYTGDIHDINVSVLMFLDDFEVARKGTNESESV